MAQAGALLLLVVSNAALPQLAGWAIPTLAEGSSVFPQLVPSVPLSAVWITLLALIYWLWAYPKAWPCRTARRAGGLLLSPLLWLSTPILWVVRWASFSLLAVVDNPQSCTCYQWVQGAAIVVSLAEGTLALLPSMSSLLLGILQWTWLAVAEGADMAAGAAATAVRQPHDPGGMIIAAHVWATVGVALSLWAGYDGVAVEQVTPEVVAAAQAERARFHFALIDVAFADGSHKECELSLHS